MATYGLHAAPNPLPPGARILDLGCGTGIWCRDIAKEYPSATVIGVDISPPATSSGPDQRTTPSNVSFHKADVQEPWSFAGADEGFDLIHCRLLFLGVRDWNAVLRNVTMHLKPGGYVQLLDVPWSQELPGKGVNEPETAYETWTRHKISSVQRMGVEYFAPLRHAELAKSFGLEVVKDELTPYYVDPKGWDKNTSEEIGDMVKEIYLRVIDMLGANPMIWKGAGLTPDEGKELSENCKDCIKQDGGRLGIHCLW